MRARGAAVGIVEPVRVSPDLPSLHPLEPSVALWGCPWETGTGEHSPFVRPFFKRKKKKSAAAKSRQVSHTRTQRLCMSGIDREE